MEGTRGGLACKKWWKWGTLHHRCGYYAIDDYTIYTIWCYSKTERMMNQRIWGTLYSQTIMENRKWENYGKLLYAGQRQEQPARICQISKLKLGHVCWRNWLIPIWFCFLGAPNKIAAFHVLHFYEGPLLNRVHLYLNHPEACSSQQTRSTFNAQSPNCGTRVWVCPSDVEGFHGHTYMGFP